MGRRGCHNFFYFFSYSFTATEGGGFPNKCRGNPKGCAEGATKAPLLRRAREIPPKAGVSRVYIDLIHELNLLACQVHNQSCSTKVAIFFIVYLSLLVLFRIGFLQIILKYLLPIFKINKCYRTMVLTKSVLVRKRTTLKCNVNILVTKPP